MKFLNCLLILVLYLKFKPADGGTTDICNYKTCGECISSVDYCVWCSEDGITERCRPWSYLNSTETWCKDEFIENPKLEVNYNNVTFSSSVQFIPTIMTIRARPGNSIPIEMFYKPAKDYPLDVYYLMDTSFTMKKHIDVLQKQANDIHSKLTELTNNVFLGAGSFIEKQAFPYYDKHRLQVSHAFKNLVSLTNNVEQFKEAVNIIKFGSNQDDPEAGLDALMQVMTCKNELGWRNDSRKIIVLCTDNLYHSAGDGKMIGIIKPNDMQCHYKDGVYATETELDYPSVSQINKIATENGFIIIFAVVKTFENVYKALASQITGASYSELSNDSNVIKIIIDNYKDQIKKVQLSANFPKFVKLSLIPDCSVNGNDSCEVSLHKPIADIKGTLTIISCPEQPLNKLEIGPVGLLQDKLTIQLDVNCQCKCENENATTSPKCHDAGYYQCGICKCMEFRYGNDCRCNGTSTDTSDSEKCKIKDMTKECNGRGKCRCGKCEDCQSGFSGEFCEFNDNACPSINRKLCADNGLCRLGRCHCKGGWRGDDCNCPISDDTCIAPRSTNVCSGNGDCVCGSCNCKKSEKNETYSGLYCDICEECAEKRCKELEGYVYCNYQNNKTICDEQFNTTDIQVLFVNKTEINGPRWYSANWCRKELDDGSFIAFKYDYHDSKLILIIQKEKELPPKANIWVAVGSAIGAVLLIGLLTLIVWKILIDIYDTREYNKFATESAAAGYEILDNPIFKKPEVNYKNPAYSRNCSEEFDK